MTILNSCILIKRHMSTQKRAIEIRCVLFPETRLNFSHDERSVSKKFINKLSAVK